MEIENTRREPSDLSRWIFRVSASAVVSLIIFARNSAHHSLKLLFGTVQDTSILVGTLLHSNIIFMASFSGRINDFVQDIDNETRESFSFFYTRAFEQRTRD